MRQTQGPTDQRQLSAKAVPYEMYPFTTRVPCRRGERTRQVQLGDGIEIHPAVSLRRNGVAVSPVCPQKHLKTTLSQSLRQASLPVAHRIGMQTQIVRKQYRLTRSTGLCLQPIQRHPPTICGLDEDPASRLGSRRFHIGTADRRVKQAPSSSAGHSGKPYRHFGGGLGETRAQLVWEGAHGERRGGE